MSYSALLALLLVGFEAACCAAGDLTLTFPEDRVCGTVAIGPPPTVSRGWADFFERERLSDVRQARGVVTFPQRAFVELSVNRTGAAELAFLRALPADGIHSLKVQGAMLGNAELASLARFTKLRELTLTDCTSSAKLDVALAPGAAALESLSFSMTDQWGREALAAWAAKCPRLQYIYDNGRAFDLPTVRLFKGHPSLDFLTVTFAADAAELIAALNEIPRLRALNVRVETDDYLPALPLLKGAELLNWNGGQIDAPTLKLFGQLPKLRTLRFQGGTKLQADFARGLPHLAQVEELTLNADNDSPPDELQAGLCAMKRLVEWPRIERPTMQTLDSMALRGNLKSLDIDGLGPDATLEQVVRLCQTESLETVSLHAIPFTAALGDALSGCPRLRELSLEVENFDGNNLGRPERFVSLELCSLVVDQHASHLAPLGRLPKLRDLSLSLGSLQPLDYRFVAESRSLITFRTQSNVVNDEAIEQIARSQTVTRLFLGENCLLSDAGLEQLAQCHQLRDLWVGGHVTAAAIRQLDRLPALSSLSVSSLLPEADRTSLGAHFAHLELARFNAYRSRFGVPLVGPDGYWREADAEWREEIGALEGKSLRTLLGPALSEAMEQELRGKVVLIDFWGTWCGPCLALMPDLQRFHEVYGKDGFAIVGIHTKRDVETLDDYLRKNPKPWLNLPDSKGNLAAAFAVPHYPGLYLFDRQGKLRLAVPFRPGMEAAIRGLLREAGE